MQTRAKFKVTEVKHTEHGTAVTMSPVVGNSKENESFYKYTPSGSIQLSVVNPALDGFFKAGKEYTVDFNEAPPAKPADMTIDKEAFLQA